MKAKRLFSYLTLFTYAASLTSCKTTKVQMPYKAQNPGPYGCYSPMKLARSGADPALMTSKGVAFKENKVNGYTRLHLTVSGLNANSDYILYYQVKAEQGDWSFHATSVIPDVLVPGIPAGRHKVYAASCVDSDRVAEAERKRFESGPPTTDKAGYVGEFGVFCGPLELAKNVNGAVRHWDQPSNSGRKRMEELYTAEFNLYRDIDRTAAETYEQVLAYEQKAGGLKIAEQPSPLGELAAQIKDLGKHGYILMVRNEFEKTYDKTIETVAKLDKKEPATALALADAPSTCKGLNDYGNTQTNATGQIDYNSFINKDQIFKEVPVTLGSEKSPSPTPTPPAAPVKEGDTPIPPADINPPVKDKSGLRDAGIALLSVGSIVVAVGGVTALAPTIEKWPFVEKALIAKSRRDNLQSLLDTKLSRNNEYWSRLRFEVSLEKLEAYRLAGNELNAHFLGGDRSQDAFKASAQKDVLGSAQGFSTDADFTSAINKRLQAIEAFRVTNSGNDDAQSILAMLGDEEGRLRGWQQNLASDAQALDGAFTAAVKEGGVLKNGVLSGVAGGASISKKHPFLIAGAVGLGVIAFIVGLNLLDKAQLADAPAPEKQLIMTATNNGQRILQQLHRLRMVDKYLEEEINKGS